MKTKLILALLWTSAACGYSQQAAPVRLAIYGLVHDHVGGMIPNLAGRPDVQLVGVVEPNKKLAALYAEKYHLDPKLFFTTLDALRATTKVDAVATFTSTFDHPRVVEMCAPLGIDVMMEKPFALNMDDARAMAAAARKGGIKVVVNYETTWYPSNASAYDLVHGGKGDRRDPQDRGARRPQGPRAHRLLPLFSGLADGPRAERRRRDHGLWVLRGRFGHVAHGWEAAGLGLRRDPDPPARPLPEGGRRRHDRGELPQGAGHHRALLGLALWPQGHGHLRRDGRIAAAGQELRVPANRGRAGDRGSRARARAPRIRIRSRISSPSSAAKSSPRGSRRWRRTWSPRRSWTQRGSRRGRECASTWPRIPRSSAPL
jgi:hypothetical protein